MNTTCHDIDSSDRVELVWVPSMGGPLIVVPESAVNAWEGCTAGGSINGDGWDDYDRACEVEDRVGVIAVGAGTALVLSDEPATTCFLPERLLFVRWLAADTEDELFEAAEAVLLDPDAVWEDGGVWVTDGPALLMDAADAGADLEAGCSSGGRPERAVVRVPAGRWRTRAIHQTDEFPWVGVVRLVPADGDV
ncbi:Imm21 family immunity protein [Streptomyces sp. NPDC058955]|uniref:Imm21 family immunity protein n=1 Tax=unclassified Streptomyces TaxID=2593676 RepID=UPI00365DB8E5